MRDQTTDRRSPSSIARTSPAGFCVLLSQGVPAPQAYEKVGYKPGSGNAINLMKRPKIAQRLTELRQALAEAEHESNKYAAEALGVTKESLIAKYESIAGDARADGQHSAAVSAYKRVSILSGHRVERQEIGNPNDFAAIEAMSRAELVMFITDGFDDLLLERQRMTEAKPLQELQSDSD